LYTYANEFDPAHTLDRLSDLGIPPGASIVLDVEALKPPEGSSTADVEDFVTEKIAQINAWGKGISNHAFLPCGYFGAQELLTSEELSRLWTFRYHEGASNLLDRNGKFAIPSRGYAIQQGRPCNVTFLEIGAVPFDVDFHCADYHDDVFSVVVAS